MSLTKRIILGITVAAILSVAAVFLSGTLDSFFSDKDKLTMITPLPLSQCVNRISEVDSCRKMFLCMEGIVLLLAAFVVITEGKNYKTEQLKITDKIKIPAPAGEGQHGTARFLTKKEIKKSSSMTSYTIDEDNELIQRLMSCGRRLYDEAENHAAKDNSIAKYRSFIVEKAERAEPIWTNGEMSILAAAILCVVYDNMDKPQYQNLTNVYWFIAEMCKDVKMGQTSFKPIIMYVAQLPENHPAKPLLGISSVAPSKTAGSFYTSALTTLRLFITQEIYNMTKDSDFSFSDLGKKKSALFFILPDQSTKYYPIVTMYVSQIYNELVTNAKQNGNCLALRTNFVLDEFGNFAKINGFETMLTVGRGYGIRFNLFIQDFNQLTAKYQKDVTGIIKGNCSTWVYLASSDSETREDLSKRLGQYTTSGASTGSSTQRRSESSRSVNVNLIGRNLLTADEIGRIKSPYLLVSTAQEYPAITELPDLSQCIFNKLLGLGSKKHNIGFIMLSQQKRKLSARKSEEVQLWGIWKKYNFKKEGGFFG